MTTHGHEPTHYQPRPQFGMFAMRRLPEAGPLIAELTGLVEKWRAARDRHLQLAEALVEANSGLREAREALAGLRTAAEVAEMDGEPPPTSADFREAEKRIATAEVAAQDAADRQWGFVGEVKKREVAADEFLQSNRTEIIEEYLPYFAEMDYELRQTLRKLGDDFAALREVMIHIDHVQQAVQGAERLDLASVNPVTDHVPIEPLTLEAAYLLDKPFVRLPEEFHEVAAQLGVVVRDETNYRIPANLHLKRMRVVDGTGSTEDLPEMGDAEDLAGQTQDIGALFANGPQPDPQPDPEGDGPGSPPEGTPVKDMNDLARELLR